MRFLCSNCKAKYQLPDEKVAGRTLRMNCRQCKSPIIIRGEGASMSLPPAGASIAAPAPLESMRASAPSAVGVPRASLAAPVPLGVPLAPAVMPAPLGVLRASVAAPPPRAAPPPLAMPSLADAWHVGINDVPVGPMSRDEVGRKIALGAVGAESLAWCEGMGDWLPVRHIPELASLLGSRMPPPPEPPKAPPLPVYHARRSSDQASFGAPVVAAAPPQASWSTPPPEPRASHVFPAAPAAESRVPPAAAAQSWGRMFAMAGGLAFLMTATAIFGVKYLRSGETPPTASAVVPTPTAPAEPAPAAPAPAALVAPAPPSAASADLQLDVGGAEAVEPVAEPEVPEVAEQRVKRAGSTLPTAGAKPAASRPLTAEQKEMLARMGGGLDSSPTLLNAPAAAHGSTSGGGGTGSLTAAQLNQVRLRGQENLKRCYETALRSAGGSQETMRMDIEVTISPSGNVTEAKVSGNGLPGMDACLTRIVRMWRFPSSGETTQTKFPVVFQPGG